METSLILEPNTVLDRIQRKSNLSSFAMLVLASYWKDSLLLTKKNWTLLVPTNAVLGSLVLNDSLSMQEKDSLVASYIVDGKLSTIAITKAIGYRQGVYAVPNMLGEILQFSKIDMDLVLQAKGTAYAITSSDIVAQNGIVHVIDTLQIQ
jgi:uncharacterized surface protein with fasciclin (FAS1) repeats